MSTRAYPCPACQWPRSRHEVRHGWCHGCDLEAQGVRGYGRSIIETMVERQAQFDAWLAYRRELVAMAEGMWGERKREENT